MCGIAGLWRSEGGSGDLGATARAMTDAIAYRGPDDQGHWTDPQDGIALGHRRLSIIDLSPEGHQPMFSAGGRYAMVFNGEVYNFEELRAQLPGVHWRGHSDTEVMLAAIEAWGLEASVRKFVGMFAFALWDREERKLHLVRDRLGIKPVYYGWSDGAFLFASELKPFRAVRGFAAEIDHDALALFLRYNYIPAPYSIYRGVHKLPPGTILTVPDALPRSLPQPQPFWTVRETVERGLADPYTGSEEEATADLDRMLREAVRLRMVADVPLGAFLSGGIDSSLVVAQMQAQSARPVKTFTIGFKEEGYNEAEHAKAVAAHLGTEHTELYVSPQQAMDVLERLPALYDEPFADSSQVPTYLVSELTRRHVTVSLSGDGGDELFTGYNTYPKADRLWRSIGWAPSALRQSMGHAIPYLPNSALKALAGRFNLSMPGGVTRAAMRDRIRRLSGLVGAASPEALFLELSSHWKEPASLLADGKEPPTLLTSPDRWPKVNTFVQRMMAFDLAMYMPDDILTKVDRASMAVSLEARVPIIDHRVVEFAWRIPLSMKLRDGRGKWLLRQVLYKYVPAELVDRPKKGFGVPVGTWLRGPLRDWAEDLLDARRLRNEGYLNPDPIRTAWDEHLNGTWTSGGELWGVLMFQAWLQANKQPVAVAA